MSKKWIPFIGVCLIAAFVFGLTRGAITEAELQADRQVVQRHIGTTIAVVNADIGAELGGNRYNYSAAIINTLGDDFVLVSPAMAQTGFANGTYGAVITFPSDVSTRVLSFNALNPERIQLEFQINPNLPERAFLETYVAITELQLSINTTLANTYVSSILRQFHEAQDQVEGVFQNNLADLIALELITLRDFTETLELDEVPRLPLDLAELDTRFHMQQVASFAEEVSNWYLHSYGLASDQFLWMREGLFRLTDNFSNQEDDWLAMLSHWTGYSIEYGELLERFAADVQEHEDDLLLWHLENVAWNEGLADYRDQIESWHRDSNNWFDHAVAWYVEYLSYLSSAMEFSDEIVAYRAYLEESLQPVIADLTTWKDSLIAYEQGLQGQLDALLAVVEEHNLQAEVTNAFLEDLLA